MVDALYARLDGELRSIRARDQWRDLRPPQGYDFCSNDYLNLARHPQIVASAKKALEIEGYGSSSSRFIRGDRQTIHSLEVKLARFKRCDRALLFSSGYAANVGSLSSLIKKDDLVFSDQLNHASIIDGLRLSRARIHIFPHLQVDELRRQLGHAPTNVVKFLVTESLFSMDGDIAPLDKYAQLARDFNLALVVDEAHALGLYGKRGSGLINQFGVEGAVTLSVNGLGKAFGCYGAFVAGSKTVIDYVTQSARTSMYSTALPPLAISAIDVALGLIEDGDRLRAHLFHNVSWFKELLPKACVNTVSPIIPMVIGDNKRTLDIAAHLLSAGFDVKAIRPPTVQAHKARLRITTNLSHSDELIKRFVQHLRGLL